MSSTRNPACQACGQGRLYRRRLRRRPAPLVVLGFALLIPAVLGAASGLYGLGGSLLMGPSMLPEGAAQQGFFEARRGLFLLLLPSLAGVALGAWLVAKETRLVCQHCAVQRALEG